MFVSVAITVRLLHSLHSDSKLILFVWMGIYVDVLIDDKLIWAI